jgi:hypothetical protein
LRAAREEPAMNIKVRRLFTISEERREEAGRSADFPLRRTAAIAVVENPYAGRYVEDLKPMIDASVALGEEMARLTLAAFGRNEIQSYGKGGLVGLAGEQEHANALLTTAFADPFRKAAMPGFRRSPRSARRERRSTFR